MKNKFLLILCGIVITVLFALVSLTTYFIYEIHIEKIVGSLILFYYKEIYYLTPTRGMYFLGILIGLIIGFILILSYHILKKTEIINYLITYSKNMENKIWKSVFLILFSSFVYMLYTSIEIINTLAQTDITGENTYLIGIILLLINIIILLLIMPILLYVEKKAFRI